jgi:hypothetical protein
MNMYQVLIKNIIGNIIEFLVIINYTLNRIVNKDFNDYINRSQELKRDYFKSFVILKKMTDIDITLSLLN